MACRGAADGGGGRDHWTCTCRRRQRYRAAVPAQPRTRPGPHSTIAALGHCATEHTADIFYIENTTTSSRSDSSNSPMAMSPLIIFTDHLIYNGGNVIEPNFTWWTRIKFLTTRMNCFYDVYLSICLYVCPSACRTHKVKYFYRITDCFSAIRNNNSIGKMFFQISKTNCYSHVTG